MAKRQRLWAKSVLAALRESFGNACQKCGRAQDLEFDCIEPMGHAHHVSGVAGRAVFYKRQVAANNLQLLCKSCHIEKTLADRNVYPF